VNGKYTHNQRLIYNAVLAAHQAVMYKLKAGVNYKAMHLLAEHTILQHLHAIGIIHKGKSIKDYEDAYLASVFMPHGLGHLVGMNTHDVGGLQNPADRSKQPGLSYLRLDRDLKAGMVTTVEPGLYFNKPTIRKALNNPKQAQYINESVVEKFYNTGGVRIEDDVLITEAGCENLTLAPVTIEDIESIFQARLQKS
jgi:Xaa-Pro dipeptidase